MKRILVAAAQLATVEGLDGLSIGRLAERLLVRKRVEAIFDHRREAVERIFGRR